MKEVKDRDESYDRGRSRYKDDRGRYEGIEEIVDLGVEVGPILEIKVKRDGVITAENQNILCGNVRRRKGIKLNKENQNTNAANS